MALLRDTEKDFEFARTLRYVANENRPDCPARTEQETMLVRAALHIENMADEIDRLNKKAYIRIKIPKFLRRNR